MCLALPEVVWGGENGQAEDVGELGAGVQVWTTAQLRHRPVQARTLQGMVG